MARSNARLEVSGAGKTEDGLVQYNEEVNKLGDDLRELYETIRVNVDEEEQWKVFDFVEDFFMEELEIGDYINDINSYHLHMFDKHDVTTKKLDAIVEKAGKVDANYAAQIEGYCSLLGEYGKKFETVCAMLALDLIGVKVFRYSDETAEAVASGEKLLKESGTIYESFADMMSPDDAAKYLDFLANGSREGLTSAELAGVEKADALLVSQKVGYEDVWDLRNVGDLLESGSKGGTSTVQKVLTDNPFDEAGNLKHNIKYQTGEFKYNYETDANGRISNWNTDNLQLTERDGRLNYNSDSLGKIEGDHAGHIAGDRFGGSPELDNIVSQSQNVNLSQYKKIENQWAKAISEGKEVTVNIDIKYDGDGFRPIEFNVEYTIDGDFFSQSILN